MAESLDLPLHLDGHVATLHAVALEDGTWDLTAVVDGRPLAKWRCSDWVRVERFRTRAQARLACHGVKAFSEWGRRLAA